MRGRPRGVATVRLEATAMSQVAEAGAEPFVEVLEGTRWSILLRGSEARSRAIGPRRIELDSIGGVVPDPRPGGSGRFRGCCGVFEHLCESSSMVSVKCIIWAVSASLRRSVRLPSEVYLCLKAQTGY